VDEAQALMEAMGIPITAARRTAVSADAAVEAAATLGYPVALKGIGPSILHKTERGAVHVGLADEAEVRAAARDLTQRLGGELDALLVQRMAGKGVEMLVGALLDPTFGPLVVCGAGGTLVDLVADSAFRLHPLTAEDGAEMLAELRVSRLLRGYRGAPPANQAALLDVVLRVSALLGLCPEIHELDLNPVIVDARGAVAVDVRARVERDVVVRGARRVQY
jgi:acyl-CoA synthetase (NDP forming)